jgi:hypothetical protein
MTSIETPSFLARSAGGVPMADLQTLSWSETVLQIPVKLLVAGM